MKDTDRSNSRSGSCTPRMFELAQPKPDHTVWLTKFDKSPQWGTQEPLRAIPKSALATPESPRIQELSTPKKNFQTKDFQNRVFHTHSIGRPSVIWEVSNGALHALVTPRTVSLAKHKTTVEDYERNKGRPRDNSELGPRYTIWEMSQSASNAGERPHTMRLAQHRAWHRDYQSARPLESQVPQVSPLALKASSTGKLDELSTAKERNPGPYRSPFWKVQRSALQATPTSRMSELAQHKNAVDQYQLPRNEKWAVTRGAKRHTPSTRTRELATPIQRQSAEHLQFRTDAFVVKESALKGGVPGRIHELAQHRSYAN